VTQNQLAAIERALSQLEFAGMTGQVTIETEDGNTFKATFYARYPDKEAQEPRGLWSALCGVFGGGK
jgi:hypothetical protein